MIVQTGILFLSHLVEDHNCGILSFRHFRMFLNTQENIRNTQLCFVLLIFPFVFHNIDDYAKDGRPEVV